jgi:release factor glutamine methyltransferase
VVDFEPPSALFVPDENPLQYYHAIAHIAKKILRSGGTLYLETHESFHSELSAMLFANGFQEIELGKDLNGKPRFVSCKKL